MRIASIADVHVGNHQRFARGTMQAGINARAQMVLDVMRDAVDAIVEQKVDALVIPGDLFDTARPEPQLIAAVQELFEGIEVIVLVGNHEQSSDAAGDHALGPLAPVANVVEVPCVYAITDDDFVVDAYMLPYSAAVPGCDYVEQAIADIDLKAEHPTGENAEPILFAHLGIEDSGTPVWLRGAHDSIKASHLAELMRVKGISCAIVGNWHDHRVWRFDDGIEIIQCGALVPTGFNNMSGLAALAPESDPYGSVIVWDSKRPRGKRCSRIVINGPRFVQSRSVQALTEAIEDGCGHGHTMFAEAVASPDVAKGVAAAMRANLTVDAYRRGYNGGALGGIEVAIDADDVRKRISTAALAARDATSTDAAIGEYIEQMPLDQDIDRQTLLDDVRACIAGA